MSKSDDGSPVEDRVGYRIKDADTALRAAMDRALSPLGLTVPQYACMAMLDRTGQQSKAELARSVFVTRQTMTVLLDGMEDRGRVSRIDVLPGTRAVPYELSNEGRRLLVEADRVVREVESVMIQGLSAEESVTLRRLLAHCTLNLRERDDLQTR